MKIRDDDLVKWDLNRACEANVLASLCQVDMGAVAALEGAARPSPFERRLRSSRGGPVPSDLVRLLDGIPSLTPDSDAAGEWTLEDLEGMGGEDVAHAWTRHFLSKQPADSLVMKGGLLKIIAEDVTVSVSPDFILIPSSANTPSNVPKVLIGVLFPANSDANVGTGASRRRVETRLGLGLVALEYEFERSHWIFPHTDVHRGVVLPSGGNGSSERPLVVPGSAERSRAEALVAEASEVIRRLVDARLWIPAELPTEERLERVRRASVEAGLRCQEECPRYSTCPAFQVEQGELPSSGPSFGEGWIEDNFSTRAANRLLKLGIKTPADLRLVYDDGDLMTIRGFGRKSLLEVEMFLSLAQATEGYQASSAMEEGLEPKDLEERTDLRLQPLEALELHPGLVGQLQREDILTVGDILGLLRGSPIRVPDAIASNRAVIERALRVLRFGEGQVEADEDDAEGIPRLMEHVVPPASGFLQMARAVLLQNPLGLLKDRDAEAVICYFGVGGNESRTLENIGDEMGVTRERVRQVRDRGLERLREILVGSKKVGRRRVRVPSQLPESVAWLRSSGTRHGALPTPFLLSAPELQAEGFGDVTPDEWARVLEVALTALGFRSLRLEGRNGLPDTLLWHDPEADNSAGQIARWETVRDMLLEESGWLPLSEIRAVLSGDGDGSIGGTTLDETRAMVESVFPTEIEVERGVRMRLPWLRGIGLQARRVLLDEGEPLPAEEIRARVQAVYRREGEDVPGFEIVGFRGAMNRTEGLTAVSKSGWWICSEWRWISTAPLVELMGEVLSEAGGLLSAEELLERVREARPWTPESSVINYLSMRNDVFAKRDDGRVALRGHEDGPGRIRTLDPLASVRSLFRKALFAWVQEHGPGPHRKRELVESLAETSGLPAGTIFRRLSRAPWVEESGYGDEARVTICVEDFPEGRPFSAGGEILPRIIPSIRDFLEGCPGKRASFRVLREHLEVEHRELRDHIYRALREMPDLRRETVDGVDTVCLQPREGMPKSGL